MNTLWLRFEAAAHDVAGHEALAVHDTWLGPTKLVHGPAGLKQRIEFALAPDHSAGNDLLLDEAESRHERTLQRALFRAAQNLLTPQADADLRNPIAAAVLRDWVQVEGHAVATDEQGNLRLAIHYRGFDGQMRIECGPRRLRTEMTLGSWTNLPPLVEAAMLRLAAEANARTRLVRIVWREEGVQRCCRAQVDLTGAPWVGEDHPRFEAIARHGLQMALAAIELAARRLGRELTVLADPDNRDLAEMLSERSVTTIREEKQKRRVELGPRTVSGAREVCPLDLGGVTPCVQQRSYLDRSPTVCPSKSPK
jgi:hypothetical protein